MNLIENKDLIYFKKIIKKYEQFNAGKVHKLNYIDKVQEVNYLS